MSILNLLGGIVRFQTTIMGVSTARGMALFWGRVNVTLITSRQKGRHLQLSLTVFNAELSVGIALWKH